MYEFLFLDLDETILDFHKAQDVALDQTLRNAGIDPTPEAKALYTRINLNCWEMLERKEITLEELKYRRFPEFFAVLGVQADDRAAVADYQRLLSQGIYLIPRAMEAVISLRRKYRLFIASNGTGDVQRQRIAGAGLEPWFENIFISDELGANKPSPAFFEKAFARIPGFDKSKAIIVGDSLTSDMLGGINAGITTCWVNPQGKPRRPDIPVDYEIRSLAELETLLETL